jgi:peptidyl-prolyl cis-trans isomerase D
MLDALRASTQTWIGRAIMTIVMGFLIIAFGFWGIADIFRGFGANRLARVGSIEITTEAYRNAYQNELLRIQEEQRRAISADEAHQMGLDRQVLGRLLSDAVLDQEAHRLGLAMSDQALADRVFLDDAFKGANGQFDRNLFEERLRDAGITESRFVGEQRTSYLRGEIIAALDTNLAAPKAMLDLINRYYNETRSIDYFVLPKTAAGTIPTPSEADLKAYYEAHRDAYRAPEYRKISVLVVTPATLADRLLKTQPISDAEIEKRYDEVKATRYTQPEHRDVEQIVFSDEASAKAASAKLSGGESFDALVAERKLAPKDVSLGMVTKADLADKSIADAAFALPAGGISKPFKTQFGWAIVRAVTVIPPIVEPLSVVKSALIEEMALARASGDMSKIHDAIEDQRANGKSVAEAAQSVGLAARTLDAIDARGRDKNGNPVADLDDPAALSKAVFASDIGVDNEPINTHGGGTIWFDVLGIEPARQQSFDEVKQKVAEAWTDEETSKRLASKAADLVKKLNAGETLAAAAASQGNLGIKHIEHLKRSDPQDLSQTQLAQVFDRSVGTAGSAAGEDGTRILFRVIDAKVSPLDVNRQDLHNIVDQMKTALDDDLLAEYVGQIQSEIGIEINQPALASTLNAPSDTE